MRGVPSRWRCCCSALVLLSLFWDAPLEGLADPMQTPNPAKAPWYFLGLQELLHYFPPVVGGVLIPTLVVLALIVIPYFGINIEAEGFWIRNRAKKLRVLAIVVAALVAVSGVVRRLRGAHPDGIDRRSHVSGGFPAAATRRVPAVAAFEAAFVLDHVLVSDRPRSC